MEVNSQSYKNKLRNQIEEAYGKVVYTYTAHIIQAKRMQNIQKYFKWLEIICSAITTGSFLVILSSASLVCSHIASIVGGLCSLLSIALTLYFKDVAPKENEKQIKHFHVSNKLWSIREEYLSLLIDFDTLETDDIRHKREQLKNMVETLYENAPITSNRSYELARRALKKEENQFFTQEEINQILPKNLRHNSSQ